MRLLTAQFAALLAVGCVAEPTLDQRHQVLRPDEPNPYLGISYGDDPVEFYDSLGGDFRVHWATDGVHAPPLADASPDNGVPDFVDTVAAKADEVNELLNAEGWRVALSDASQSVPNGGDGRFDIYLVDFGGSSDGLVVKNACDQSTPGTCTAHMLIENDFSGSSYASTEEAITVLVSHEYFHAVQNAYVAELPAWWSEGTATWFEEYFDPTQDDFERLANQYFDEAGRSLDSRSQGPFDSFSYGIAAFAHFIELQHGAETLRQTFEELATGAEPVEAIDSALIGAGSNLTETFELFAIWNAFTAGRANGDGYPAAAGYDAVPVASFDGTAGANWDIAVDSLAAQYGQFQLSGGARIAVAARDGFELPSVFIVHGPDDYEQLTEAGIYVTDSSALLVVANGDPDAERAARVTVRNEEAPSNNGVVTNNDTGSNNGTTIDSEEPKVTLTEDEGGCSTAPSSPNGFALVLLAFIFTSRRRRRPTHLRHRKHYVGKGTSLL